MSEPFDTLAHHREFHERMAEGFDVYCVAHDSNYAFGEGAFESCHSLDTDNECHPDCPKCTVECPHEPCPWGDADA